MYLAYCTLRRDHFDELGNHGLSETVFEVKYSTKEDGGSVSGEVEPKERFADWGAAAGFSWKVELDKNQPPAASLL